MGLLGDIWEIIQEWFEPTVLPNELMPKQPDEVDKLIEALCWVESRGNVNAIGDRNIPLSKGGPAYGILQIRGGVLWEVNALWGTEYESKELLGESGARLSKDMCKAYFLEVCPQYKAWKATKVDKTEWYARAWNAGIGWEKKYNKEGYTRYSRRLDNYWEMVKARL